MSCLVDPDPDPDPVHVVLGGLCPGVSEDSGPQFFSGERRGARGRSAGIICRVALSGLLLRPAPTAGQGPLAGEAPLRTLR